jgi:hypothetical protein
LALAASARLDGVTLDGGIASLAAIVLVTSAVASIIVGVVRASRQGLPVSSTRTVPTRYEVRCARAGAAQAAERRLASWWETGLDGAPMAPDGTRLVEA